MPKRSIFTNDAPKAIGPYSQAVMQHHTLFVSGQVGLAPHTKTLVGNTIEAQAEQVFKNLIAIAKAAQATINDFVQIRIYLTNLNDFSKVNDIMHTYFEAPYPARATIEVSALPLGACIEIEGILSVPERI